ncbi:hypothetical protein OGAPHI_003086 [Ogataea philodendri]|uniref:Mannose-6-phosphate isomerase n=1 Tax=Ogataea philodendri TaxID=1378263 RepID=A0A9P8P9U9_9ASCO|nr:uncharacterized protein OGAPHI_003086 [Ogataea philodendri]KAH3667437.1 hypothetical protein OGAPHI_003086 [Ogataea philodendri]
MTTSPKLFRVIGGAQNYDWGKLGSSSAVARFAKLNDPETVVIDEEKPYAELWMGTHPSVPTVLPDSNRKALRELVTEFPEETLGPDIIAKFGSKEGIPFLFKVLSIRKVLSIQAHPDKTLAKQLHASDPKHYPDDNHKPEMAVAITDFEAFCGFKPLAQIDELLQKIPEFKELVGADVTEEFHSGIASADVAGKKKLLQKVFSRVMNSPESKFEPLAASIVKKTKSDPALFGETLADLIQRLDAQFPNDIGLFCGCLMLNHCTLKSGEAIFLEAKDPHAYISGDIMECMAASDNVIRAGFTPKFKDVDVLVDCLTYSFNPVEEQKLKPAPFPRGSGDAKLNLYDPPIDEFSVLQTAFSTPGSEKFEGLEGPSLLIVTEGKGKIKLQGSETALDASTGNIFFIAPKAPVELISESNTPFTSYRAYCEA